MALWLWIENWIHFQLLSYQIVLGFGLEYENLVGIEWSWKSCDCAKVSKLEISFCKFSCMGISRSEKSALHRGMLNHLQMPDGKWTAPPMPALVLAANASAAQSPCHWGFGRNEITGERNWSHRSNILRVFWELGDNFLFEDPGSRRRIHILRSVVGQFTKSLREFIGWWRTWINLLPIGIAVPAGFWRKFRLSSKHLVNWDLFEGSIL